ncbi:MAG: sulfatase [Candidatus Hinthialibacter antarcticus]|nr:sulfatase [Candidatus Hinthialibacter antarcticus]
MDRVRIFVAILAALAFNSCAPQQKNEHAQSVLLITLDTVRADALSCYQLPPMAAQTDNLDGLAAQGTLFLRANCNIPATLTSHTSIMTGNLPRTSGVRFAKDQVPEQAVTLAEVLKLNGFSTAAFLSAAVLNKNYGLNQGFDVYDDLSDSTLTEADRAGDQTTDRAIAWLKERQGDGPFFLWVHYYDAHSPYHPQPQYDHYGPEGYEGRIDGSADQVSRFVASKEALSDLDRQRLRSLYLGEVEYMDDQIGRLLNAFDEQTDEDQSLVVALADHGENLGEEGRYFHGADLYSSCMQIPMIVRWPGGRHAGEQVEALVQGIDVMPTVAAACGFSDYFEVEGKDLAAHFIAKSPEARTALMETENEYRSDADKMFAAETLRHKLIDRRWSLREPVLVGRFVGARIEKPCYLRAWLRGDSSVNLVAHLRFHTQQSLQNPNMHADQPTILVRTSRFGLETIHNQYPLPDELKAAHGWLPVASPDLYERAVSYAEAQGWPTDAIILESIAVDMAGTPLRTQLDVYVDDIELVGAQNRKIDSFETSGAQVYQDAGTGADHQAASRIEAGKGMGGSRGLRVSAKYSENKNIWAGSEFYEFENILYPVESTDVLKKEPVDPISLQALELSKDVERWLNSPPGEIPFPTLIDPTQSERLRSLGYL